MTKEEIRHQMEELKQQQIDKAIEAGFTKEQAEYLIEKFAIGSLGMGNLFL